MNKEQFIRAVYDAVKNRPEKRLIAGGYTDFQGGVCAIGAYLESKGCTTPRSAQLFCGTLGTDADFTRVIIEKANDGLDCSPEERYTYMLSILRTMLGLETLEPMETEPVEPNLPAYSV